MTTRRDALKLAALAAAAAARPTPRPTEGVDLSGILYAVVEGGTGSREIGVRIVAARSAAGWDVRLEQPAGYPVAGPIGEDDPVGALLDRLLAAAPAP